MTISTQQSFSGFIASEPQKSVSDSGITRFYARVGQPHFRREDDGSFTELDPTFHDLVAFRITAERAFTRFAKGDRFIAEGYVNTFSSEQGGLIIELEEFVAKKIGHDASRTNYNVDRTRRNATAVAAPASPAAQHTTVLDAMVPRATSAYLGL
ncbi:single-stranded DNA-binding protein [Agromyces italicus]|uniref:single-stranded DNA-binding protein n=1 Tax=Agromyces italicus TaxID=279572 RepID=UPI0003B5DACA|nr:single-stranded DNA-binding protein [Agromyces italicus]